MTMPALPPMNLNTTATSGVNSDTVFNFAPPTKTDSSKMVLVITLSVITAILVFKGVK